MALRRSSGLENIWLFKRYVIFQFRSHQKFLIFGEKKKWADRFIEEPTACVSKLSGGEAATKFHVGCVCWKILLTWSQFCCTEGSGQIVWDLLRTCRRGSCLGWYWCRSIADSLWLGFLQERKHTCLGQGLTGHGWWEWCVWLSHYCCPWVCDSFHSVNEKARVKDKVI